MTKMSSGLFDGTAGGRASDNVIGTQCLSQIFFLILRQFVVSWRHQLSNPSEEKASLSEIFQ